MIKRILITLTIGVVVFSCANDKKEENNAGITATAIDSTVITDSSWGAISRTTDFEELKTIFGAANVIDEKICGPECVDSIDVTKVYRETNKELIIHWADDRYHKTIHMIENTTTASPYKSSTGLKIGSTMRDLLNENGQPISFLGFGWDYGGNITSFNKGNLGRSNIKFRLGLQGEVENQALLGDTELTTAMPNVKEYLDQMIVYQLYLVLNE